LPPLRGIANCVVSQTPAGIEASASKAKDAALAEAVANEKQRALALLEASGGGTKQRATR
jgi:hypothetical protein